mgnify:CR=1 FL=1
MKRITFNKQFMVLMFLLLNCFASYAADENLITKQITLNLTEAGTLPNKIGSSKKNLITNLKLIGEINGTDLLFIRKMAGSDVNGSSTFGNLSILDLSDARIVEGGDVYYYDLYQFNHSYNNTIGNYAFYGCKSLTNVIIPSNVTKIGKDAFNFCESLTSVNIPSSVTKIGEDAFGFCTSLTSVNIPSNVTDIGLAAFRNCTSLTSVNIPSSVTLIDYATFSDCSSLTSIKIPSSVTTIGGSAFEGCTSLTSVKIPSSVTEIGEKAFAECNSLKSIYVYTENIPSTGTGAFKGCDSKNCTLYVPKGTYDAYWLSEFGYFENIVEFDATSIHNTIATSEVQENAR